MLRFPAAGLCCLLVLLTGLLSPARAQTSADSADAPQPKRELLSNIYFTKQVLEANNIVYGIKSATGSDNFVDEIFSFAGSIEADYILTTSINYGLIRKNPKYGEVPIIWINPHKRLLQNFN